MFFHTSFLQQNLEYLPKFLDKKAIASVNSMRDSWLKSAAEGLPRYYRLPEIVIITIYSLRMAQSFYLQVSSWMIKMESDVVAQKVKRDEKVSDRAVLFIRVSLLTNYYWIVGNDQLSHISLLTMLAML